MSDPQVDVPLQGQFGAPDTPPETVQRLQKLSDQHKLVAHLRVGGKSLTQIAQHIGWTPSYVSQLCSDPLFTAYKMQLEKDFRESATERLADLVSGASTDTFNIINDIMHAPETGPSVKLRAAQMLIDRQMPLVQKIEQDTNTTIKIEGLSEVFKDMHEVFQGRMPKEVLDMPAEEQLQYMENLIDVPGDSPE